MPAGKTDALSPEQRRALLARLLQAKTSGSRADATLSHGQKELWLIHQLAPASSAYNVAFSVIVRSPIELRALETALSQLTERHASLRTSYPAQDGLPQLQMSPPAAVTISLIEAADWSEEQVQAALQASVEQPFDLASGPLLRASLVRRSATDQVLLLVFHHIAIDGWSMAVILDELFSAYAAIAAGQPLALPPLTRPYSDYSQQQQLLLASQRGEQLRRYWHAQLAGELPILNLPLDHPRPAVAFGPSATVEFSLAGALIDQLRELARGEGTTLYVVLLAGFQALLQRYTGQEDLLIGTPMANRNDQDFQRTVGYFVSPVVLRADLTGQPTGRQLIARARESVLGALDHQEYPFSLLVEELQPIREPGRSPLFEVMFNLQQVRRWGTAADFLTPVSAAATAVIGGLRLERHPLLQGDAQFDLSLDLFEGEAALYGRLTYNRELFEVATIERLAASYELLLAALVAEPERVIGELPILTVAERQRLLGDWNATAAPFSVAHGLAELVSAQAVRTPTALALVWEETGLTYAAIDERSNQLAHYLQGLGVGPEVLVAVCLDRSPALLVALLGILKAGGAYVPLDPAYPPERLAFMLDDSAAPVIVTEQAQLHRLPHGGGRLVSLDGEAGPIAQQPTTPLSAGARPDQLAYVLYTSGSTGRPKGVAIEQRSVLAFMAWAQGIFSLTELAGTLASTSVCFDLSVFELFFPLTVGGTVILARNALEIGTLPAAATVTLVNTVPSAMTEILRLGVLPPSVKTVNLAGEPLPERLARALYATGTVERVYNLYGPSEDTTYSTYALVERERAGAPPIGRPIANTRAYVLDPAGQPTPPGVPGELYLGGAGLARGYLNRPELTAERFVPDPFSDEPGARLYRTGDLVRYRVDSVLEYLGRLDHQVKLRGFRIELGEIEASLREHPVVAEVVVVAHDAGGGDQRLVAYLTTNQAVEISALRGYLRERLPDYMVPNAFIVLSALPQTPNGKIDRKALPAPESAAQVEAAAYVAPTTPLQQQIAAIWQTVLKREQVGIRDNFFDLGGHSLLIVQVHSRLRALTSQPVAVADLFRFPTVESLARHLGAMVAPAPNGHDRLPLTATSGPAPLAMPTTNGAAGVYPLTITQRALWMATELAHDRSAHNVLVVLGVQSAIESDALRAAVQWLTDRHAVLRTTYEIQGSGPVQIVHRQRQAEIEVVEAGGLDDTAIKQAALERRQRAIDLRRGPVLRVTLFRRSATSAVLVFVLHHIVIDGWSMGIILDELITSYAATVAGQAGPPSSAVRQFADYVLWQQAMLASAEGERLRQFWHTRLAGELPVLTLPTDRPRQEGQAPAGGVVGFTLERARLQLAREVARQEETTLFSVLLAAFALLLQRTSGHDDLLIGTPAANRARPEFERTVGYFVDPVVLRIDLAAAPTGRAVLQCVHQAMMAAIEHQEFPFPLLFDELRPAGRGRRAPLFSVTFNFQRPAGTSAVAALLEGTGTRATVGGLVLESLQHWFNSGRLDGDARADESLDLAFSLVEQADSLIGYISYNAALFTAETIERWIGQYQQFLQALCDQLERPIAALVAGELPGNVAVLSQVTRAETVEPGWQVGQGAVPRSNTIQEVVPLTHGQRALWLIQQLVPESPVYNIAFTVRILSPVDAAAMRQANQYLVERHAALRTTFSIQASGPVQVVHAQQAVHFEQIDVAGLDEEQIRARVLACVQQPFSLEEGPLLRVYLLSRSATDHVFIQVVHHIAVDGWSLSMVLNEGLIAYRAIRDAQPVELPPVAQQYPDYVRWQEALLASPVGEQQRHYWHTQLSGELPVLNIPTDRPRQAMQIGHGATMRFTLKTELISRLRVLARQERTTPFVVLLAGFQLLLQRYCGQDDIIVGAPAANRTRPEFEQTVGYFASPMVLRTDLAGNPTGHELLQRVRETVLGALENQEYPFPLLVEELQPSRDPSRSAIIEVLFNHQRLQHFGQVSAVHWHPGAEIPSVEIGDLTVQPYPIPQEEGRFDLNLDLHDDDHQVYGTFHYNHELFEAATIERLVASYELLLAGLAADPTRPIGQLPVLPPSELQRVVVDWNQTATTYPSDQCLPTLIAAQAARTPQAIAVVGDGLTLTYAELETRANQLAHHLQALGVGPETLVAVCLERSALLLVGLLGILKAGGAYVPLDPAYPVDRLAYMLDDSGAALVLTETALAEVVPSSPATVVALDTIGPTISTLPTTPPQSDVTSANRAYVIYTSGSTGRPKGVEITHQNLVNFLLSMAREPGLVAADVLVAVTTLSFDIAGLELYLPLLVGARVVVASRAVASDGTALGQLLVASGATVMQATPATWRLLLDAGWPLRRPLTALCGGEALPLELAARLLAQPVRLWNLYGPTETTVWSTVEEISTAAGPILVGRPIANTTVYILDAHQQPVPIGVAGELYIGGHGVARGYLNRPALTAERFVANPFADGLSVRLYRTGDLARCRADGRIEVVGRIDHQVKVRGYRIELGEIEAVLAQHPAVAEVVVVAREAGAGDQRLVAYLTTRQGVEVSALRGHLRERLPEYMVPSAYVLLDELPRTPNGKVDRKALPAPESAAQVDAASYVAPSTPLEQQIASVWQRVLKLERVGLRDNFFDLGGHSLLIVQVHTWLRTLVAKPVAVADLFRFPTIETLARYLDEPVAPIAAPSVPSQPARAQVISRRQTAVGSREIAVIGLSGRFPGAPSVEDFWQLLRDGREGIHFFSRAELLAEGIDPAVLDRPNFVPAKGAVADSDRFDAAFFGINPREAEIIDPQHRLFLECAWTALEDAGYDPERAPGAIGVFAGASMNSYLINNLLASPATLAAVGGYQTMLGNDKDFLATRVAYKLNLKGPSLTIQTACSTSLVAIHQACQSLLAGQCDLALAGGVSLTFPQRAGYLYQEGMILSPDGHCRAFDAAAGGTVGGEGVGLVVLKRLDEALADGDHIRAVIKGSHVNNDGNVKVGYTAPSVDGQAEVIATAQALAGVSAETISYVEAHGTGTALGDPVEVAALTQAFRTTTDRVGFCAIGSVKTNIGHLDTAAGVAGLIKAVLALEHGQLPPSLHFTRPNPSIDFAGSPFVVNTQLTDWPAGAQPRRAGVSSFGIGGTNAHVVLEEAPARAAAPRPLRPWHLLPLSARTPAALEAVTTRLASYLQQPAAADLTSVAFTLQAGRRAFGRRRVAISRDNGDAVMVLGGGDPKRLLSGTAETAPPVAFLFTGQGAQYVNMARELYESEPVFRAIVDQCCTLLEPELGFDLRSILYPGDEESEEATWRLQQTAVTQPALFVIEYALAQLWLTWGVQPVAMLGHSIGEYVAACLAGVFTLEDALRLVATRGRLMQSMPSGSMLVVPLPEAEVRSLLAGELALAAINAPALCVVSGPSEAVDALHGQLKGRGVDCRRLHTSHAFHSAMMEPIVAPFVAAVSQVPRQAPTRPFVSNVTGTWITAAQATDPAYWGDHLRGTVRFVDGLDRLLGGEPAIVLEVGPGQTLASLARQHPARAQARQILTSLRHPHQVQSDSALILTTLGQLWLAGVEIDWAGLYGEQRPTRCALPTYPFERQRFMVERTEPVVVAATTRTAARTGPAADSAPLALADWFTVPSWRQTLRPRPRPVAAEGVWLVLADQQGVAAALVTRLRAAGVTVVVLEPGDQLAQLADDHYQLDPQHPEQWTSLLAELIEDERRPGQIVHCWSLGALSNTGDETADFGRTQQLGYHSLVALGQAVAALPAGEPIELTVVSDGLFDIVPAEQRQPAKATMLGPLLVLPQELPALQTRCVDLVLGAPAVRPALAEQVLAEMLTPTSDRFVCYRGRQRWVPTFEPAPLGEVLVPGVTLRAGGVYLITGGLGQIGLALAEYLAHTAGARLVLVSRSGLPPRAAWSHWLAEQGAAERTSHRIRQVQRLEMLGAQVLVLAADVADGDQLAQAFDQAVATFGQLDGVIHAAGIIDGDTFQPLTKATAAEAERQFGPKVYGLYALARAVQQHQPSFCYVISSVSAILGGLGYGVYAAANAFIDAFVTERAKTSATTWLTVDWDAFGEAPSGEHGSGRRLGRLVPITPAEAPLVFERSLMAGAPRLVVSTTDLAARLAVWAQRAMTATAQPNPTAAAPDGGTRLVVEAQHGRPDLSTAYVAPSNEIERRVAAIWEELLGIQPIGVQDDFFELGGHSLLATQIISRLRDAFQVELSLRGLFEAATVAEVARQLAALIETAADPAAGREELVL